MNVLVDLGKYPCLVILTEWLSKFDEIGRLDCAISNKVKRLQLLNILASRTLSFSSDTEKLALKSFLYWLLSRNVRVNNLSISNNVLACITNCSVDILKNLSVVNIRNYNSVNEKAINDLLDYCVTLTDVKFIDGDITDDILEKTFTNNYLSLQSINLERLDRISERSLQCIAKYCINLVSLHIRHCPQLRNSIYFGDITQTCTYLKSLSFYPESGNLLLNRIAENCTKLTYLDVRGIREASNPVYIDQIVKKCTSLTTLNLSNCINSVSSHTMVYISRYCRQLLTLNISQIPYVTELSIMKICTYCVLLTDLDISHLPCIKDDCIIPIINNLVHLKTIHFQQATRLSVWWFYLFSHHHFETYSVVDLQNCILSGVPLPLRERRTSSGLSDCSTISQDVDVIFIQYVLPKCIHTLTSLTVVRGVDYYTQVEAAIHCMCLTTLNLDSIPSVLCDGNLILLSQSLCMLTDLSICSARLVTDNGLMLLITVNRRLESLNICGCIRATDKSLQCMAVNCRGLTFLNLSDCKLVTDDGILALSRTCLKLQNMHLSSLDVSIDNILVPTIKKTSLVVLFQQCENLEHIQFNKAVLNCRNIEKYFHDLDSEHQQALINSNGINVDWACVVM